MHRWRSGVASLAIGVIGLGALGAARAMERPTGNFDYLTTPQWMGASYFAQGHCEELDALIEKVAASRDRDMDGRYDLEMATEEIADRLNQFGDELSESLQQRRIQDYLHDFPNSAFAPILDAMHMHALAWRARGTGWSSSVTPEGWTLFHDRSKAAWNEMLQAKARSSRLAVWYSEAISIGLDADVPMAQLTALFEEGIARFPGSHAMYFAIERPLSPRWGGDYKPADAFIRAAVASKHNPEGDILYTRLYRQIDHYQGDTADFFTASKVSWPRMRAGFEQMMKAYPNSFRNIASFAIYACRAGDAATYWKLHDAVIEEVFSDFAPAGLSMEVCDARLATKS